MKAHISVATTLVLATTSHGRALREGIEEKKDTSNIDGVRMDSSSKVIKSNPVSGRNLMQYQNHPYSAYSVERGEIMDYGNAYSVPHVEFEGEENSIPQSYHHDDFHNAQTLKENYGWEMAEFLQGQDHAPPQAHAHHHQYPRLPSGEQTYSQHSSIHQNHLPHSIVSPYDMPVDGVPAPGHTSPLPGPPHTHQRAPLMLPHKPYQPERDSGGPSSGAVDADSDASDSSDESGNHIDRASGSRSGEIGDHRNNMAISNYEEPENDSDDAAESDSNSSQGDKKPRRIGKLQKSAKKTGRKAVEQARKKITATMKSLSFKKTE